MQPLNKDEELLLQKVITELGHQDRAYYDALNVTEKRLILDVLKEQSSGDGSKSLMSDTLWEMDYDRKPVGVSQFLTDPDYLGMDIIRNGDDEARTSGVFECWHDVLCELFDPAKKYHELVVSSAIGTGKSSMASLALIYKLYQMSCLRDPQNFYGLMPGHKIVFGIFTVFKYKARELGGDYVRKAVEGSPYFREVFPYNPDKKIDLEFPKSIAMTYGASGLSAIGLNLFSVMIDEAEFMKGGTSADDKGQAFELYTSTVRRMESRFMRQGTMPGIMIQISSKASADSYLSERIKNSGGSENILMVEKTGWEVKPWRYTGDMFPCFTGDAYNDPRILTKKELEDLTDKSNTMMIPVEHKQAFTEDIYGALRDLANVATGAANPLIPNRSYIQDCITSDRKHPFSKMDFHVGNEDELDISDFLDRKSIIGVRRGQPVPRLNPSAPRFIHLDLAVSGDALGMCVGHISGQRVLAKADKQTPGLTKEVNLPEIEIDMFVRIVPKKGSKIRFEAIRNFIGDLRSYGYNIGLITADTYQSTDMLQILSRQGFNTKQVSMDRAKASDAAPFMYLKDAIMENRLTMYDFPILTAELVNLQRYDVVKQGKVQIVVDHPAKMLFDGESMRGSKDVADALCGVVYMLMTEELSVTSATEKTSGGRMVPEKIVSPTVRRVSRVQQDLTRMSTDFDDYKE